MFFVILANILYGAQYKVIPSFSLRQSYDDNIYLYWRGKKDDFVTYIRPKILASINTEKTKINTEAQVNILRYADETNLNTEEQIYRIGLSHLKTERLTLALNGRYIRDTTLESEWTETGIGLERNIRKNYSGDGLISYSLTEKSLITFSSFYMRSDYESAIYIDYWYTGGNLAYEYHLSDGRISLISRLGYNYFKSDLGRTHNVLFFGGIDYMFSEKTQISGFLGLRYSDSKVKLRRYMIFYFLNYPIIVPYTETKREKGVGALLNVSFSRKMEKGTFFIGIERDIIPSVIGEMIFRGRVYSKIDYNFTERLKGIFYASYYRGETSGDVKTLDYYSYDVRPSMQFFLTKNFSVELAYLRQFYKSRLTDFKAERNVIFLGINWSKLYLWQ
ncbi:MAG: outer membrane beta-barrel protein [Candidatus Desulfofervidus auxilii]|nr:outer membrane beta-barrel protein [Candidatus Desulfofervidus auxilii]